eukprot:GEZU01007725.1.p1 GENE.GEZU01007725.1~~GEZU01007725.1.p1  ORF type:complete len:353 (-),score=116.38 GEZU01007725.1:116-1174(-)
MSSVTLIQTESDFNQLIAKKQPTVVHFWAAWCGPCLQMDTVVDRLAAKYPTVTFAKVDAESVPDVTEKYEITSVPTFLILKDGTTQTKLEVADPAELSRLVDQLSKSTAPAASATSAKAKQTDINARLKELINQAPLMLFMKGTPSAPRCGFSASACSILREQGLEFGSFNVLSDEEVRNQLKSFVNWPTYPMFFAYGKLLGGLDILKELVAEGQLKSSIEEARKEYEAEQQKAAAAAATAAQPQPKEDLNTRLTKLINQAPVMLFMKGQPDAPRCGFSSKIVQILRKNNIQFEYFDILTDEDVRQGLKAFSKWPTYPQLYSKGTLIGGLDIVKELDEAGQLLDEINAAGGN